MTRKRIGMGIAIALVAWLGWRWWSGDDGGKTASSRASEGPASPRQVRVYENGKWVTRDGSKILDAFSNVKHRPAGLFLVAGVVRDADSMAPIPGAEVVLAGMVGENSTYTDDEGHYEIAVAPGLYRTFARADGYITVGYAPTERVPSTPDANQVGLPIGHIAEAVLVNRDQYGIDLSLTGAAEIYGTVYDSDGYPIAGALVVGEQPDHGAGAPRPVQGTHIDETGLDGSYRIVVPAGYSVVEANHIDYAGVSGHASQYLAAGDEVRMDLTLARGCIIAGTVTDVEGYRVSEGSLERHVGGPPPNDFAPATRIDANGDFRLALKWEGDVTLRAWPWKSAPSVEKTFDCYDGAYYDNVRFVAADKDADLEGSIVDARGQPIAHAFVDVIPLDADGMAQQERADEYGEWAVYNLPAGRYHVKAFVPGLGAAASYVEVPSRGMRLQLGGTGSVVGRVHGIENGSMSVTLTNCTYRDQDDVLVQFDDITMPDMRMLVSIYGGSFQLDDLPACQLSGRARSGTRHGFFHADVKPGEVTSIEVDMRHPHERADLADLD